MSRPFRALSFGVIPNPGRCPGLVCHAPAGLIPTSLRKVSETLEEIASNPLLKKLGCGRQPTPSHFVSFVVKNTSVTQLH